MADEPSAKHVLILHGSDRIVQASTSIDPAMRSTLLARAKQAVTIDTGLLDIAPELQIANEPPRRERLLAGSRDRRPDLIMPLGSIALDFARSHTDLWPGVPIFFYGVADDALLPREAVANVAGLTVDLDVEATLALALNLQPDARELIWIAGAAAYDRRLEQRLTRALQERSAHLQAFGLSGYTLDELEQRLRDVDPGSIVLYLSLLRDHAGGTYLPQVVARRLVEISPAPVYGVHDADFGDGIVGGSFPDLDAHGRQAGALAAEFLNGERSIAEIGIEVSPSVCSLDARALAHWQLTANRAPPNCRVLFQPLTFWQQYRDQLLLSFAAVVLGLALASLVNLRRKHRRAQVEAQQTRLDQAHTARLALVGEISASIAHEITQPLSSILSNAEVAQLLLDAREPNLPDLREIVADIRLDNLRANRIVNHVHDLLQRRELKLERVKINVVATRVLDLARPEAARRGIALRAEFADGAPEVTGDPHYLEQVLLNLIVNALDALRAAQAGARLVEVRTVSLSSHFVRVDVSGCGHAIAHHEVPHLFDASFRSKHEGVGVGLSVARAIVETHGGRIWADWTEEAGATLRFTLPLCDSAGASESLVANR